MCNPDDSSNSFRQNRDTSFQRWGVTESASTNAKKTVRWKYVCCMLCCAPSLRAAFQASSDTVLEAPACRRAGVPACLRACVPALACMCSNLCCRLYTSDFECQENINPSPAWWCAAVVLAVAVDIPALPPANPPAKPRLALSAFKKP